MGVLYNLVFIIFAFFYVPFFLFKKKKRAGVAMRFGIYPKELIEELKKRRNIWVHAVSVGEVMAISSLLPRLRQLYPDARLVLTTVTETGNSVAKGLLRDGDIALFLPFDITFSIKRAISGVNPSMLIIAETEIWPNLIREAKNSKIPIILVNGRISDSSFKRYIIVKFLIKGILSKITHFCMQSETDRERIVCLGAEPDKVEVSGNIKFDSAVSADISFEDKEALYSLLNLKKEGMLFVAGSTHPGEEEIIISCYARLKKRFNNLRLLIAPRHIERADEVEKIIIAHGLKPVRISQLTTYNLQLTTDNIFILDAIGKLKGFYSIAKAVFIGGSLIKRGGQNMIEPAVFAKPILFGPYTFNFRDVTELFLKEEAAIMVKDRDSLKEALKNILENSEMANRLGRRAKDIVEKNRGAIDITLKRCAELLGSYK